MKSLLALIIVISASSAFAQTATPSSRLAWDQIGQPPAAANGFTYTAYVDGATAGISLVGAVCNNGPTASDATCVVSLPPLVAGAHTVSVTQSLGGAESAKSVALSFTVVIVVTPTNVRLQ